ncbi:hypothetical protein AVEN_122218-1 [Araneus ventricosus]|uniref:Uncharacterized protein n=1 Tax=Araneus ventricosus TaxID=182803 RepID=A0A4Y2RNM5_ARAVE|nr:hypothetical protein AVEN_11143-1 [Araneus ventricosus]GBN76946.1 hypothetical protein AVEN_122218-1 [Araneus ventricosus]
MIGNKRDHIRELGFRIIIKTRNVASKRKSVRSFQPPKTNFLATDYIEMIPGTVLHFHHHLCCEDSRIKRFGLRSNQVENGCVELLQVPCNTQAVKRCVKLVTEASQKSSVPIPEMCFIRTTLLSRSSMPSFSYFKVQKKLKTSKGLYLITK